VGFTSLTGVATLGAVVFLSGIRRAQREEGLERGLEKGCLDEMRPVVMACMAAGIGLLPAAVATSIGAQAQQPLARVVVGGMITTVFAILFVMPLLVLRRFTSSPSTPSSPTASADFQAEIKAYNAVLAKAGSDRYSSIWVALTGRPMSSRASSSTPSGPTSTTPSTKIPS
jgi:hypothetical protein